MSLNFEDTCSLCAQARGESEPHGGWVYRQGSWGLGALPGLEIPGWISLTLVSRHVEGIWNLTEEEASSLGPALVRAARVIQKVTGAERVYTVAYGDSTRHFHVMLMPRYADSPAKHRGPGLLLAAAELRDPEAALNLIARIREAMSTR